MPEETVIIRRQWNDWRKAVVLLSNIENLHWSDISGGVQAPAPRPFMHVMLGYIWCDQILKGELALVLNPQFDPLGRQLFEHSLTLEEGVP